MINGAGVCDIEFSLDDPFFFFGSAGVFSPPGTLVRFDDVAVYTAPES